MALGGGNNQPQGIVIQLIADFKNFLKSIQQAGQQSQKILGNSLKTVANSSNALGVSLAENIKLFERMKSSAESWGEEARKQAKLATFDYDKVKKVIQDIADREGVNKNMAAQVAVATGQVGLGDAQGFLSKQGKGLLLTEEQINLALRLQAQQLSSTTQKTLSNAQAVKVLTIEQMKLRDANFKAATGKGGFLSELSGAFRNIAGFLGSLFLFQYALTGISEELSKATDAYLELSKANFALEASVKASQSQIGSVAGSVDSWRKAIENLRREFPQFSEKDVTKAIAALAKLQPQLGFSQDKMMSLAKTAATLSQITGTALADVSQDIIAALGGSSVVLDKYALFLRDADKNNTQLAKSLGKTTAEMNSQELALATLEAIQSKVAPLTKSIGDYNSTAAGKIATANSKIEDSYTRIGESTAELQILSTNFFAFWLERLQVIIPAFDGFTEIVRKLNDEFLRGDELAKRGGGFTPEKYLPEDSAQQRATFTAFNPFQGIIQAKIIEQFRRGAIDISKAKVGAALIFGTFNFGSDEARKEAMNRFLSDYEKFLQAIKDERVRLDAEAAQQRKLDYYNNFSDPAFRDQRNEEIGQTDPAKNIIDPEALADLKKYQDDITDLTTDYNQDYADLARKSYEEQQKLADDYYQDRLDAAADYHETLQKLEIGFLEDKQDVDIDYQRDLADLEADLLRKREKIQKEHQDKTEEAWRDYYRALEILNMEYSFDLRDAVGENDAVQVKRLERKYQIDKKKLDNQLQDRLENEQNVIDESLEELEQESKDRRKELEIRYKRELEDLNRNLERRQKAAKDSYEKELRDIDIQYKRKSAEQQAQFSREENALKTSYQRRLEEIGRALGRESTALQQHYGRLFATMQTYLGPTGEFLSLVNGYYDELLRVRTNRENDISIFDPDFQQWLEDEYGITIPDNFTIPGSGGGGGGSTPPPGYVTPINYQIPDYGIKDEPPSKIQVEFSSDGTIPEHFYDAISQRTVDELTEVIRDITVRVR